MLERASPVILAAPLAALSAMIAVAGVYYRLILNRREGTYFVV